MYLFQKLSLFSLNASSTSENSLWSHLRYAISMPWNHCIATQLKRLLYLLHTLDILILYQSIIPLGNLLRQSRDVNC